LSTKIEAASVLVPPEDQELVLLETLKALLSGAIRALSCGEPASLAQVSRDISAASADILAVSLKLDRFPMSPEAQQHLQKLLTELRRQRCFCRAMLRRWRRSILLRQQLLDLATAPIIYTDSLDPRWGCHE